jgi:hypothetical protein
VPTKECFPGTDVAIWLSDALDLFSQRIPEKRVEGVEVPLSCTLVHEGPSEIGSIDGRRISDSLPKLSGLGLTIFSF